MATLTFTHDNITLTSSWRTTTGSNGKPQYLQSPTLVYANPTFNVTGIPSNAVINSAKVYFTWGAPSFTDVSALFFTYNNERTNMTKNSTAEIPISITGNGEITGSVGFRALGWLNKNYIGYYSCNITATDVKLVVDYTIPYTAPSAPTSVSVASTNVAPGASVKLSWSGAAAGTNNAITGYHVHRATSANGSYSYLTEVSTSATSGSVDVTAPTTNGSSYYYKAYTKATQSDYLWSAASTAYATLTTKFTAPTAPTVKINNSTSAYVPADSGTATLSWSGASAGTNNPIASYLIYVDGTLYGETPSTQSSVSIPAYSAGNHSWTVITKGSYSNSSASSAVIVYAYSAPAAPTSVTINDASSIYLAEGNTATLKWSGAGAGTNNPISSYLLYVDNALYGETPSSVSSVNIPSYGGGEHKWKVITKGAYSNSAASSTASCFTYTATGAPTSVSLAATTIDAGTSTTLSWSGAKAGTYNTITGYHIYRSTAENGTYSLAYNVSSTSTAASTSVAAPSTMGQKYYYKVYTIGSRNLNSGPSSAVSLTAQTYSAPSAPTSITINDASSVYIGEGSTATLKWSGASAGTNNAIVGYLVYVGDSLYADVGSSTTSTSVPSYGGGEHKWKVVTKGTHSNSAASSTVSCFTYTATSAPTSVSLAATTVDAGASTTLSWSGAKAGTYNAITGYHVYRATSENGAYSVLTAVESTSTAANTTVNAPSTMGNKYYYKVYTIGARNYNSGASSVVSLTAQTYSVPSAPTSLSLSANNVVAGATVTLSWSGAAAGTNNAITGYKVYRSTKQDGTYELLSTVNSTATSGSLSVIAPSTTSSAFYYKIITVGTKSGFLESGYSSVITLQTKAATPTPPTTIGVSGGNQWVNSTTTSRTITWSGASGGDGAITGYNIYQASSRNSAYSKVAEVSTSNTSGSVALSFSEPATTYYIRVSTVGALGESAQSESTYINYITPPQAPTNIMVSKTLSDGASVSLSWNAAEAGYNNPAGSYTIYRSESTDGSTWGTESQITSGVGDTSITITPPTAYGNYYRYKVIATGTYDGSTSSAAYSSNTLRRDHAPITFAENITARETNVRAQHMTELQNTIAMLLEFYGLDPQTMPTITAGTTPLSSWTGHVNEIRAAIDFLTTYHDEWLEIPVNVPRADIMNQLRNILLYVEKPQCVLGVGKLGAMITR